MWSASSQYPLFALSTLDPGRRKGRYNEGNDGDSLTIPFTWMQSVSTSLGNFCPILKTDLVALGPGAKFRISGSGLVGIDNGLYQK